MANFEKNLIATSTLDFYTVLQTIRTYLTSKCSDLLNIINDNSSSDKENVRESNKEKLTNIISSYISSQKLSVSGMKNSELVARIYKEVAEFSILTDYIKDINNEIEEINVNAWNDVEVIYSDGRVKKAPHFENLEHATMVITKLTKACDSNLNDAHPMAEGSLNTNTRVVTLKNPVVDEEVGVACSIRLLKPNIATRDFFIKHGTITEKEMKFLELAIRSGVSMVFVGSTGSGKTTLMNYLLSTIPNSQRVITIEHNARELNLVKTDKDGNVVNNVVHTQTRTFPKDEDMNISQEDLLVKALRLDPNVICVGEMRDAEAYAAEEASLTGHTVVTSLHADGVRATHHRIATLALKRFPMDINVALLQASMAFPLVICLRKLGDNSRRVMQIAECSIAEDSTGIIRDYTSLFEFVIKKSQVTNGEWSITDSEHRSDGVPSKELLQKMVQNGASIEELEEFGYEYK